MRIISTLLDDVYVIESPAFSDHRGAFTKLFHRTIPPLNNYKIEQINFVENKFKHTLRGLHYQDSTYAESKFFRVLTGKIQLGFVDLRTDKPDASCSATYILDSPDIGVLIPRGFATGYLTLEDNSNVLYYSDNIYKAETEKGIRWNDPLFDLMWHCDNPKLSKKDQGWSDYKKNNLKT
jgi:dTDP-4-dehydrorhamnose 3,5-epimerase